MTSANDTYAHGLAAFQSGDLDTSEQAARAVLAINGDHADAWQLLGVTAYERGDFNAAIECLVRAIERDALKAEFFYNLGVAYAGAGRRELAISNYRTAIERDTRHHPSRRNLATELRAEGEIDAAVVALEEAVALFPDDARLGIQLAKSLRDQGRVEEAFAEVEHAAALAPNDASIRSEKLFLRQYVPGADPVEMLAEHRAWNETQPTYEPCLDVTRLTGSKLRVGFVSPDLGYHPVGLFLAPLLEHFDSSRVEAFCYSHRGKIDDQTRRLASSSTMLDVRRMDDAALAKRIADDGIDVLFDLAGHTDDNRLPVFARRPAPVQITWAGYVGTTGLDAMDHLLADRFHVPEGAEANYSENVLRMPHGYVCYEPPEYAPQVDPRPRRGGEHVTFGCFNNASKMNGLVLATWARILADVPGSRLVLKYTGCDQPVFGERVVRAMRAVGVDPSRVACHGRTTHVEHLRMLGQVDVALDPFPYSGGLSTLEAIWMGVPVVTCPGETFASRHSLSHLSNAGATAADDPNGTIVTTRDEYVARAVELATSTDRLAHEHGTLRTRMAESPLLDHAAFTSDLTARLESIAMDGIRQTDQQSGG